MATPNQRSQYDKHDSLELGQRAESRFARLAQRQGWEVSEASRSENIEDHYDYQIAKEGRCLRVDVKSRKRLNRKAPAVQDHLLWVEFRTVRNTKGWLFGSADLIAFETKQGFKIVERKALVRLINKLVKIHVKVDKPEDALYKVYTRNGRPDEITLLKVSDLDAILWEEWRE